MDIQDKLQALLNQLNTVIVGKPAQIQDCVACLLAGGHLLIDDVPGVGPSLKKALLQAFGSVAAIAATGAGRHDSPVELFKEIDGRIPGEGGKRGREGRKGERFGQLGM